MRIATLLCAAIMTAAVPTIAMADDPHDPTMRSARARARDHEIIRRLNLRESAHVRERDARYAAQNDAYVRSRQQYEHDMANWRRAVSACQSGDYSACGN
ncbi:hypothetical protein Y88_1276 [Novosphingobium nitrogenifigens DSM 19370]|uniref:Secreted protein n=1 Tax=Novosphingobium nitrogenifigens DSM 19370 TaxID=983920 RepID=F1Z811_9SPHN|nr:hypothetical protein [Novosphingobium nitrogenifigens]EGD59214.1 hypothetical protein Y88_1276 [Novosphingobium nitrogenifigens DSM 19370]